MKVEDLKLGDNSFVSISLVIAIVGAAGWLTMVFAKGEKNASDISELKVDHEKFKDKVTEKLDQILEKLGNLEGK